MATSITPQKSLNSCPLKVTIRHPTQINKNEIAEKNQDILFIHFRPDFYLQMYMIIIKFETTIEKRTNPNMQYMGIENFSL